MMSGDAKLAVLYKDTFTQVKLEKEHDYNNLKRIHDQFDYFKDQDKMYGKPKSRHDLKDDEYQTEDDIMSTELSDEEANELYKRYKLAMHEVTESREALEEKEEKMIMQMQQTEKEAEGAFFDEESTRQIKTVGSKIIKKKMFESELEKKIAEVRLLHSLKNLKLSDVLDDGDEILDSSFSPYRQITRQIKDDPELPQELRRILNNPRVELQNLNFPVTDAQSSKYYTDTMELKMKYLKAKWEHYLDSKLSQVQVTTKQLEDQKYTAE